MKKQSIGVLLFIVLLAGSRQDFPPAGLRWNTVLGRGLTGEGQLIQNQGTARASRIVQLASGRALISIKHQTGKSVVTVKSEGLPTEFITIE